MSERTHALVRRNTAARPPEVVATGTTADIQGHAALASHTGPVPQHELAVGSRYDPAEREAEELADRAHRHSGPGPSGHDINGEPVGSHGSLSAGIDPVASALSSRIRHAPFGGAPSLGRPLPEPTRRDLQDRLGFDFGSVRIHADRAAARVATGLHARAFSTGRDIYFAPGAFAPDREEGRRLLVHELAHVVQAGTAIRRQMIDGPWQERGRDGPSATTPDLVGEFIELLGLTFGDPEDPALARRSARLRQIATTVNTRDAQRLLRWITTGGATGLTEAFRRLATANRTAILMLLESRVEQTRDGEGHALNSDPHPSAGPAKDRTLMATPTSGDSGRSAGPPGDASSRQVVTPKLPHPRSTPRVPSTLAMRRATTQPIQRGEAGQVASANVGAARQGQRKTALVAALRDQGNSELASIVDEAEPTRLPFTAPLLLPPARDGIPFQMAFRITPEQAESFSERTKSHDGQPEPQNPHRQMQRPPSVPAKGEQEPSDQPTGAFWILYQNDGKGINPGMGTDQGPTALLRLVARYDTGPLSSFAMTVIDMQTPVPGRKRSRTGGPPPPGAEDRDLMYETGEGPYSGRAAAHFGFTVHQDGSWTIDTIVTVGVDSAEWGEAVQDFIHTHISNSAHFPWPEGWRLLTENELTARYEGGNFRSAGFRGHLEFDAKALTGTVRTEATARARVVVERVDVAGTDVDVSLSLGGMARSFHRYERGRSGLGGVEGATSIGVRLADLPQDWFVDVTWETVHSTDPTRQTNKGPGAVPGTYPELGARLMGGGHGTGTVRVGFDF